jgi:DNA-binding NarL/FixJ family response regulator
MRLSPDLATLGGLLTCLIVDDNASFLEAASALLEREGLAVSGVASTSEQALRLAGELHPDVVLVDVSLGAESGLALARMLANEEREATVILISTHSAADFADVIAEMPVAGFVSKTELSAATIERLASASPGR